MSDTPGDDLLRAELRAALHELADQLSSETETVHRLRAVSRAKQIMELADLTHPERLRLRGLLHDLRMQLDARRKIDAPMEARQILAAASGLLVEEEGPG